MSEEASKTQLTFGTAADTQSDFYTFIDDLGREVTIPLFSSSESADATQPPLRTAALLGSFAQVWMLSGGELCAAADDAWEDLQLALPKDAVNLGNTKRLNLELLLEANPDFILASTNTRQNLEWKDILDNTRIPVAYFDINDFEDYLRMLNICTDITGRKDLYEENGLAVQQQIQAVLKKRELWLTENSAPTVLSLIASASNVYAKNSQNNVLGEMLAALGCINIADSDSTLLENLSMEHILQQNPDYIFIVQRGDDAEGTRARVARLFAENPAWQQLDAVRNDRVYFMEKTLYNLKPNNRWGEAYEKLEEILSEN